MSFHKKTTNVFSLDNAITIYTAIVCDSLQDRLWGIKTVFVFAYIIPLPAWSSIDAYNFQVYYHENVDVFKQLRDAGKLLSRPGTFRISKKRLAKSSV